MADREGAVACIFGERMQAGWVLERCGGCGGSNVSEYAAGCCWSKGGLVAEWTVAALVRGAAFVLVVEGLGGAGYLGCGCRGREGGCCASVEMGAWIRQGQDCSLAGGAAGRAVFRAGVVGASEGRFCGDLGREDGGGIYMFGEGICSG